MKIIGYLWKRGYICNIVNVWFDVYIVNCELW